MASLKMARIWSAWRSSVQSTSVAPRARGIRRTGSCADCSDGPRIATPARRENRRETPVQADAAASGHSVRRRGSTDPPAAPAQRRPDNCARPVRPRPCPGRTGRWRRARDAGARPIPPFPAHGRRIPGRAAAFGEVAARAQVDHVGRHVMGEYGYELAVVAGIGVLKLSFDQLAAHGPAGRLGQGTRDDLGQHGSFLRKMRRQDAGGEGANTSTGAAMNQRRLALDGKPAKRLSRTPSATGDTVRTAYTRDRAVFKSTAPRLLVASQHGMTACRAGRYAAATGVQRSPSPSRPDAARQSC